MQLSCNSYVQHSHANLMQLSSNYDATLTCNSHVAVQGGAASLSLDLRDSCGEPIRAASSESGALCVELRLLPANETRVVASVRSGGDGTAAVAAHLPAAGWWAVVGSLSCATSINAVLEPSYVLGVVGVAKM